MVKIDMTQIFCRARYLILIPVLALLVTSAFIFVWTLTNYVFLTDILNMSEKDLVVGLVSIIDLFLLGVLTLMISVSLYDLYIDTENKLQKVLPQAMVVKSLDQLKNKLGKVIYLILLVTLFKYIIRYDFTTIAEITLLGLTVLFVSLSLYFVGEKNGEE